MLVFILDISSIVTWAYIFLAQSLTPVYWGWAPARLEFCSWNLVLIRSRGCIIITSIHPASSQYYVNLRLLIYADNLN